MLVDVIIPTYGESPFLINAINSALDQGEVVKNIIVIDDGSSPQIVMKHKRQLESIEKVKLIFAEKHQNPAVMRNIGIMNSSAKYLAFLDSDDVWLAGKIESQLRLAEQLPSKFICSNAIRIENGIRTNYFSDNKNNKIGTFKLVYGNGVINSTVLVDRDLFTHFAGFPEAYSVRGVEDYLSWLKISLTTEIHYMNEVTTEYLINPEGISQSSNTDNAIHALAAFYQHLHNLKTRKIRERA
jgi:glycosyltransferase involved in cell wall biosynthesis